MKTKAKKSSQKKETPLMKQYHQIKRKYPDALLLFRVGDFYETFGQDAVISAEILGIVLTKRHNGSANEVALAGFPHHSVNTYLPKLVRAGYRVAICDQLEDPKTTKTIVKRGVTELVTPGVAYHDEVLEQKSNNFLAAVHYGKKSMGLAFLDVSTGEFLVAQGSHEHIDKLLQSFQPNEILYDKAQRNRFETAFGSGYFTYRLDDWVFDLGYAKDTLLNQFKTKSLKGFGIENLDSATIAAGAIMHYLGETRHDQLSHIRSMSRIDMEQFVWMDRFTIRNLELLFSPHEGAKTLLDVVDDTLTAMGARLMKRWISFPLVDQKKIAGRHDAVEHLLKQPEKQSACEALIRNIGDLERLISKLSASRINPRELLRLKEALLSTPELKHELGKSKNAALKRLADQLNPCEVLAERLEKSLDNEAPVLLNKGNVIREGVNQELDDLRLIQKDGKTLLLQMQEREGAATGISSLKVAFNNVFGYYIEVRNAHKDKVPEEWIRKQTLVNAERYITPELKEYEAKITGAEEKIGALEARIYQELIQEALEYIAPIQVNASCVAELDVLISFSKVASANNYVKPLLDNSKQLDIQGGRHPVIEQQLEPGDEYISNDLFLSNEEQQIMMITGPNMSGKSAILRQTALICIMAQMGCFVPAKHAKIGMVDKIFTRVGASDNISSGESTFMVEMNETASILNNFSDRSLILLDEIGRGTSTYDGISIAWAIAEYLHENKRAHPKTLFATHYHELNDMANVFKRIENFNVSVKEIDQKIIFMRKLVPGGSNHSFGIHVAKRVAQLVEHDLAKVGVAGSNPVSRSKRRDFVEEFFFMCLRETGFDYQSPVETLVLADKPGWWNW